jgi:hypothetical protein
MSQMARHFNKYQCSILGVERVPEDRDPTNTVSSIRCLSPLGSATWIASSKKPKPENAPSNLAVVGRYILTPRIFDLLENIPRGAGNEIQLTDGIAALLGEEQVLAYEFSGPTPRLRQQARLSGRDGRIRSAPSRTGRTVPRLLAILPVRQFGDSAPAAIDRILAIVGSRKRSKSIPADR